MVIGVLGRFSQLPLTKFPKMCFYKNISSLFQVTKKTLGLRSTLTIDTPSRAYIQIGVNCVKNELIWNQINHYDTYNLLKAWDHHSPV